MVLLILARAEAERAAGGREVGSGRASPALRRGGRCRPGRRAGERHGEEHRLGAGITFGDQRVRDGEARRHIVIQDGADAGAVQDRGARRGAEHEAEGLIRLHHRIALDGDGDGLAGLAGAEVEPCRWRR